MFVQTSFLFLSPSISGYFIYSRYQRWNILIYFSFKLSDRLHVKFDIYHQIWSFSIFRYWLVCIIVDCWFLFWLFCFQLHDLYESHFRNDSNGDCDLLIVFLFIFFFFLFHIKNIQSHGVRLEVIEQIFQIWMIRTLMFCLETLSLLMILENMMTCDVMIDFNMPC